MSEDGSIQASGDCDSFPPVILSHNHREIDIADSI